MTTTERTPSMQICTLRAALLSLCLAPSPCGVTTRSTSCKYDATVGGILGRAFKHDTLTVLTHLHDSEKKECDWMRTILRVSSEHDSTILANTCISSIGSCRKRGTSSQI